MRVTQLVFGRLFAVSRSPTGSAGRIRRSCARSADKVQQVMDASPMMRTVNTDWGTRTPTLHFTLQQDRLQAVGLTLRLPWRNNSSSS